MIAFVDGLFDAVQCGHVIELARAKLARALVSEDQDGSISDGRTGSNAWLAHDTDAVTRAMCESIAAIVGIPLGHAEAMQVVHYGQWQEYQPHYDAYDLRNERGQRCCRHGGQRMVTALVYLNEVREGGATVFPRLSCEVEPRAGRMALFHNCRPGTDVLHPDSLHGGAPVVRGEKWAFNLWFRARPMSERQVFSAPARVEKYRVNRATELFEQAMSRLWDLDDPPIGFSYWDEYGGNVLDVTGLAPLRRLIDRSVTNRLANKRQLARSLLDLGLSCLAPTTCFSPAEAHDRCASPEQVWFVKNAYKSGGQDMRCIRAEELPGMALDADSVLQAEITDPELWDDRKYTVRVYLLVWDGELYVYRDGLMVVHGVPYVLGSTDYRVQIEHAGYRDPDSPIRMLPLREHPRYEARFAAIAAHLQRLRPLFGDCLRASSRARYSLLGLDLLFRSDGEPRLVEINAMPNFLHTESINQTVNIPLFQCLLQLLSDGPQFDLVRLPRAGFSG